MLGYTWNFNGYAVTPLASIGVAPLSVQTVTGNTTTTDNVTAYHWAIGALFTLQKRTGIQADAVYGKDYVSAGGTQYQYNRKPWLSLALGYSFQ